MQKEEGRMQKGEWLPFSLRFSFCILHSPLNRFTLQLRLVKNLSPRFNNSRLPELTGFCLVVP